MADYFHGTILIRTNFELLVKAESIYKQKKE